LQNNSFTIKIEIKKNKPIILNSKYAFTNLDSGKEEILKSEIPESKNSIFRICHKPLTPFLYPYPKKHF